MRLPFDSEPEAFRLALAFAFVVGVSVLLGYLLGSIAGIALFTLVALAAVVWNVRREPATSTLGAAESARVSRVRRPSRCRANEALPGDAPPDEIVGPRGGRSALDVIAPVLQSKSHFVTTDIDSETEQARRRLRQTLAWASDHGLEATGEVGDPIDPLAGIEDELRRYDIDEVIFTTHIPERANWLETGILERARAELGIPVRHLVIDGEEVAEESRSRNA